MGIVPIFVRPQFSALEFFAGIGLARAGLADLGIHVIWSNDFDPLKRAMYLNQWDDQAFSLEDIHKVDASLLPVTDVAWSSSPCTDLSLAGARVGLRNGRGSSAFFGFTRVLADLGARRPKVVVLENVVGLASSHGGDDLRSAAMSFNELGYSVDVIVLDARRWLPQSRPRLFMVGCQTPPEAGELNTALRPDSVSWVHSDERIRTHVTPLPAPPPLLSGGLGATVEHLDDMDARWWSADRVEEFANSMSTRQRLRLDYLVTSRKQSVRSAYRRSRSGKPVWEMRGDEISGCLRTARGGSSKQALAFMGDGRLQVRWMTGTEYARLMGASWFNLTGIRESQIQFGFGDAVAVPAVSWVAQHMILPAIQATEVVERIYA